MRVCLREFLIHCCLSLDALLADAIGGFLCCFVLAQAVSVQALVESACCPPAENALRFLSFDQALVASKYFVLLALLLQRVVA